MLKKYGFLILLMLGVLSMPAQAKNTGVNDIQELSKPAVVVKNKEDVLNSDSYAYKTLKNMYKKYGGVMEFSKDKFEGTEPLTRNEAALILVSLTGKLQKDNIQPDDVDKERFDFLNDHLKKDVAQLTARITKVETSVDALQGNVGELKGRISNLESTEGKKVGFNYGESLNVGGMFRGEYATTFNSKTISSFNIPVAILTLSGKPMDHVNYFVLMNPYYAGIGQDAKQIIDRAYVQTDIIPHHKLTLGKQVVPILDISNKYYSEFNTTDYFPQIGLYGYDRQAGIKLAGDFKYLNYQAGIFNRNVANQVNSGMAYAVRGIIKPLAAFPQYGNLEMGGSYYLADKNTPWAVTTNVPSTILPLIPDRPNRVYTAYGKYQYNDFEVVSEWLHRDNNAFSILKTDTTGWYVQPSYYLTPKIQLVGRFDKMRNNIGSTGLGNQYLAGVNYYFKYPHLKLMMNYICQDNKQQKSNNKIMIQTQYLF